MTLPTLEETPVRLRLGAASHLVVFLLGTVIALMPLAVWKGSTDNQLATQQKQLDRLEEKLDRLTLAVQERNR